MIVSARTLCVGVERNICYSKEWPTNESFDFFNEQQKEIGHKKIFKKPKRILEGLCCQKVLCSEKAKVQSKDPNLKELK